MNSWIVSTSLVETVVVHRHRTATVEVQSIHVPADDRGPALAIERTRLPDRENGRPVILVHGFAQNRYSWHVSRRSMTAFLAMNGFEVLNLELRGHGKSREFGSKNATSMSEYVDDLVRVVEGCREPPFVIGHSLGGGVGVGAATRAKLAGLVHLAGVYAFAADNLWLRQLGRLFVKADKPLKVMPIRLSTAWIGQLLAPMVKGADLAMHVLPIAGWVPGSIEPDLIQERVRLGFDWISVEIWLEMAQLAKGKPFQYAHAFQHTDVPLLVIAGDQDKLLSPNEAKKCFEESGSLDKTYALYSKQTHGRHWGHLDLIFGTDAPEHVWQDILCWMKDR